MDSRPMLSVISATWSILSTTIVLSSVTIISSLAISVAEFNSFESDAFSKTPSIARMTCLLSVFLLGSTVFAMFGLSRKKGWMLLPQIGFSLIALVFHVLLSIQWLFGGVNGERVTIDGDWLISATASTLFELLLLSAIIVELRCFRRLSR
ncbi:hypothetical protein M3Y98_00531700 [Aphelenchoides besseyi]|nr:hypothetical protein M3Y98_00531700 [Aphelenchoides besseyi]